MRVSRQELTSSIVVLTGCALLVAGAAMIYLPAGILTCGVLVIWIGWPR